MSNGDNSTELRADAAILKQALDAITAEFRQRFPAVKTVESFWPFDKPTVTEGWTLTTPAILLEVESFDDTVRDLGDDRTPIGLNLAAHCILSTATPNVEVEILGFAAAMFRVVRYNRWGMDDDVDSPESLAAFPSAIAKPKAGYEAWSVVWGQTVYLGARAWTGESLIPADVCVSFAPKLGAANEDAYEPLH